jgi:hypothetical protein
MKMLFGAVVVAGSGKIGGHVASKNKGGAYLRTKVTPNNPQTSYQAAVRDRLASLSQAWRSLTEAQRAAWNGAVSQFKRTNIFGDLKEPSGFNLYQRLNNNILVVGGTVIDTPPLPVSTDTYSNLVLTGASGTPALSLAFTAVAGDDSGYKIFATAPHSAGIKNSNSQYRLIDKGAVIGVSPKNILAAYVAKFGSVGEVGQKIDVKIEACGSTTGISGVAVSASVILAS